MKILAGLVMQRVWFAISSRSKVAEAVGKKLFILIKINYSSRD